MSRYVQYPRQRRREQPRPGLFISGWRDDYAVEAGRLRLTPARLGLIFRRADGGDASALYEMFSAVEEDPHVHSVLSKRKLRLLSRDFRITPSRGLEGDSRAQQAVEVCERVVWGGEGRPGIGNWRQALVDMQDAVGRGFALLQIAWENTEGLWQPRKLRRWHQRDVVLGDPYGASYDEIDPDRIQVLTRDQPVDGEPLEPGQWLVHVNKARSDILCRAALLRTVAWFWLFKHFSIRDWAIFLERYGMPIRLGKYPKSANDEEKNVLRQAVIELGKDAGAIIPDGAMLEFIERKMEGKATFGEFGSYCDDQISKAILGQSMTTDAPDRGARSLGEVQKEAEDDLIDHDGELLCATIRRDLLTWVVGWNLGPEYPVPECEFIYNNLRGDPLALAERDDKLAKMGLEIPKSYLYDAHQIPAPDGDEDTVGGGGAGLPPPGAPPPPAREGEPANDNMDADEAEDIAASLGVAITAQVARSLSLLGRRAATEALLGLAESKKKTMSMDWAT